ncbi:hypothetical protein AQUCO_02000156v1 [Aquilegia coerulea]|uniref:Uncharacterized protein n=1 Tax=Aquilegia coerulea TaxID=218851 RepID=A0A2G5DG81_AQUCA|nr:hypothetical protein AQUCO_02000156v1 [Aquilegia coerulea]
MASKDQTQQEKAGQMMQGVTDMVFGTAQGAMDKISGATQATTKAAGDGANQTKQTSGGYFDAAKATAQGAIDQVSGATQVAKDKTVETTKAAGDFATETQKNVGGYINSAKETVFGSAQKTPEAGGFFQTTGEQIMGTATGAGDALKNAFGMGDSTTKK